MTEEPMADYLNPRKYQHTNVRMVKLANTVDSKSTALWLKGSSPFMDTN